mmetsp:Transcript_39246/g.108104  ORF Transcript_39246/g.108104 Transcript_39246/m.108104 type:complete len:213 (-) Transcript_39246:329-967(-)
MDAWLGGGRDGGVLSEVWVLLNDLEPPVQAHEAFACLFKSAVTLDVLRLEPLQLRGKPLALFIGHSLAHPQLGADLLHLPIEFHGRLTEILFQLLPPLPHHLIHALYALDLPVHLVREALVFAPQAQELVEFWLQALCLAHFLLQKSDGCRIVRLYAVDLAPELLLKGLHLALDQGQQRGLVCCLGLNLLDLRLVRPRAAKSARITYSTRWR